MSEKILIVANDDEMLQQWLGHQLQREGYQVGLISTGSAALEAFQTNPPPDLVILNVDLPDMDGYEVARKLQEQPDRKNIPIIFLANPNTVKDKVTGFEGDAFDYLTKPFNILELIARVKATLRLKLKQERARHDLEEYKNNLSENISHELLTPLNKVLNGVDILTRLAAKENITQFDEVIKIIRRGADELRWLAQDLLIINQLNDHSVGPFRQPVDLMELLQHLVEQTEARYSRKNVKFEVAGPKLGVVNVNRKHLAQIVHHLLDNAGKFSPEGSRPQVIVQFSGQAGAEIKVIDQGKGIDQALQEKVFEKFYQVDMSMTRESGGLGSGLYIARSLARLYGGEVALTSQPGHGTTCRLMLPDAAPDWA
jgi:two-component system sensor histidine kinase/response regulator